jgi:hypothetical protein
MSTRRLLDIDPLTKVRSMFHSEDPDGNDMILEDVQDVTEILDHNKAERHMHDERSGWKGDMHRVASIPLVVWAELKREGIATDTKRLKKWLDDPDNMAFRTRPGRVG